MNTVVQGASAYLDNLLKGRPPRVGGALIWLERLRAEAVDRVGALTVPTTRDEEWRFTDISPLTEIPFHPVTDAQAIDAGWTTPFDLPEAGARLVFVDGRYAPSLSFNRSGIVVENLASATARGGTIEQHLGQHLEFRNNVFAALNTAFLHDGAWISVPRGHKVEAPVHLLFVATRADAASYPRCLIVAEAGSTLTVVEDYVASGTAPGGRAYFTNAVAEIAVAEHACVEHVRIQREAPGAFHIAHGAVSLSRSARYHAVNVTLGARLSRHDLDLRIAAEDARCTVDGVTLIGDAQLADTHTRIDHAAPHGASRQLHKCIVDDESRAVFNGKIVVRAGAQLTDSAQSSRNLLLSARAQVDLKPQLEIFADDVKCAHGAAVGELDAEEVFYLRSRGLSEAAARSLLTYAFGAEVLDRIPVVSLRQTLERALLERTGARS